MRWYTIVLWLTRVVTKSELHWYRSPYEKDRLRKHKVNFHDGEKVGAGAVVQAPPPALLKAPPWFQKFTT